MEQKIDSRDIFLRGKNVVLKALTKDDVLYSNWYGWFNNEELCKTLQKHYFPNTMESQINFWENTLKSSVHKLQLGICKINENELLGIVSLSNIDYINRKCEFSIVLGEKTAHSISIFVESTKLIFNHGFNTLNMNRIYGGSISKELVQLMCRSLGCREEGIARQEIFKNGKYYDAFLYSILREEFVT